MPPHHHNTTANALARRMDGMADFLTVFCSGFCLGIGFGHGGVYGVYGLVRFGSICMIWYGKVKAGYGWVTGIGPVFVLVLVLRVPPYTRYRRLDLSLRLGLGPHIPFFSSPSSSLI